MLVLDQKTPWAAFRSAYFCGVIFFAITMYWFIHVTLVGAILAISYLALYFGIFGFAYRYFKDKKSIEKLFLLPSVWVALEFFRAHLLTGFDWASLGQSQYKILPVIQMADITGMFGVSFILVMVNFCLKEILQGKKDKAVIFSTGILIATILFYGLFSLQQIHSFRKISVAIIQGNIPQSVKWDESAWPAIMKKYLALTKKAVAQKPDLMIWPETSFPGFLWRDQESLKDLNDFVHRENVPLLFGSILEEKGHYYNAAILLSGQAQVVGEYKKIHLVPFGEFLPLRSVFPFLSDIVPIADFTAGKEDTLLPLKLEKNYSFSVLICFEDTVAYLSREFVNRGSQLLINLTNDAWFADSKEPFLHLQSAVFRAIENRRSLVRSANTGVSCFIDPLGRITRYVQNDRQKKTFVDGYAVEQVELNTQKTFYTKFADVFTYLCFGCILLAFRWKRE